MTSPDARRTVRRRLPLAAATVTLLVGGCFFAGRRRVDSSWAPLSSQEHVGTMAWTLVPDADVGMDLPRFAVEQQVLPSGLRVGVEPGPARGMVAVVAVVGSGSSADPPEREGLAHLVEHLVYHGHARDQRPESDRLARLGAAYNADTNLDMTRFYEAAPAAALPALLDIAAERLLRPLAGVDDRDFDRERAIVENELYQRNETGVYGRVVAWVQQALFPPGHPYARPIGGSPATLRRLTLADARAFVSAHYRPENLTLLVTGEVGGAHGALAGVVGRLPETIKSRAPAAARAATPARTAAAGVIPVAPAGTAGAAGTDGAATDVLRAAVATPEIWIAYDLGAAPAAVSRILTAPAAEAAVRERLLPEPEVLTVDFHVFQLRDRTLLACQIVLEHDRRRVELAQKAQNLIWALWSDAGPPAVLEWQPWRQATVFDLRQAALAGAVLGAEPFLSRALQRAHAFQVTGAVDAYDRVLWAIGAARTVDISGVAFTALAPERARTLFLQPGVATDSPRAGPVGVATAGNLPMEASPFRAADFGAPPRASPPLGLKESRTFALPNGLTVVLAPRPGFPAVTVLLGFHGGAAALPLGVLPLVRAVEPRRAGRRGPGALQIEKLDSPGLTADVVRTDRRHLSNALFLLADRLKSVADTDWAGLLERAQARDLPKSTVRDEPRAIAAAKLRAALYGTHPYGRAPRAEDVLAMDPGQAPTWLPRLYAPRNAVLVIAGDIDLEGASRLATGWFWDWAGVTAAGRLATAPVGALPAARVRGPETVLITHRPVGAQVEVTFACRLPFPASARARAAQRLAAGLLGSTLITEIREQAGAAYSVDGASALLPGGGAHLVAAMAVDSRRLREVLRVLRGQVDAIASGRFDSAALSQVQWSLTRGSALRFQTASDLAEEIWDTLALGLPLDTVTSDVDELAQVGPDDLRRAFAPCAAAPILSLVGDRDTIRAAM